jgi:protein phosphatase 1 regulatory subunit 7
MMAFFEPGPFKCPSAINVVMPNRDDLQIVNAITKSLRRGGEKFVMNYECSHDVYRDGEAITVTSLSIENASLDSIPPEIGQLKRLRSLQLRNNRITRIEGIDRMRIETVDLERNAIESAAGLPKLVKVVNLSGNRISSLDGLSGLNRLQSLDLAGNEIDSIAGISNKISRNIKHLSVGGNISRIEGIDDFKDLEYLYLGKHISRIEGLDSLGNLEVLNLAGNDIRKIEGIDNLKNINEIDLEGNKIERIEGLENVSLGSLMLGDNEISSIDEEMIGKVAGIFEMYVMNNKLDGKQIEMLKRIPGANVVV